MTEGLPIFHEDRRVAEITLGPDGPSLAYAPDWLSGRASFPASVLMPLAEAPAPSAILVPWLTNLLPEGAALSTAGRWLGIDPGDVLGMIGRIGRDVAGALSFGWPRPGARPHAIPISDAAALERIIESLPARPFLLGEDGVSMSLAGAQEKVALTQLEDGSLAVPADGMPSTHILKPDNETRLFGAVQNEALCMVLARRVGQAAAEVTTGRAGARTYLLVTRYDREEAGDGRVRRIHQEDFCQALGKPPAAKYERNQTGIPGPGIKDMFAVVRRHAPGASILRLLDAVILNVLLCNTDAHTKNHALLIRASKRIALAPLYDLLCADAWPGITQNLAQSVGGSNRGAQLTAKHWKRLAEDAGTSPAATLARVRRWADAVEAEAPRAAEAVRAMPAGDHAMLPKFVDAIQRRCQRVRANLAVGAG